MKFKLDKYKLIHWLNIRKVTKHKFLLECDTGLEQMDLESSKMFFEISSSSINNIVNYLSLKEDQLAYSKLGHDEIGFIFQSKEELYKTKRLIKREGFDFYNYYTLPSPKGYVAPVILDILCPNEKLPKLNNGHFEAAITINLGPGPINGRWGKQINKLNFSVLESNLDDQTSWITGSSYFEPSYCPHTYSLASSQPAKILSYTVANTLDNFISDFNKLSQDQQINYEDSISKPLVERIISNQMSLLGFTEKTLAGTAELPLDIVSSFIKGDFDNLAMQLIKNLCSIMNLDFRVLLQPEITGDALGKTIFSVENSIKSKRIYKNIEWASAASSINSPDLTGSFLKVDNESDGTDLSNLDFMYFSKNSHYLVTSGNILFVSKNGNEVIEKLKLSKDDSLWVKPYQSHFFIGRGSLIKMSNGEGVDYTNDFSLGNLFDEQNTVKRAFKDNLGWGYD